MREARDRRPHMGAAAIDAERDVDLPAPRPTGCRQADERARRGFTLPAARRDATGHYCCRKHQNAEAAIAQAAARHTPRRLVMLFRRAVSPPLGATRPEALALQEDWLQKMISRLQPTGGHFSQREGRHVAQSRGMVRGRHHASMPG